MTMPAPSLTLEAYEALIAEAEAQDRRIELIDGKVVEKMPMPIHGMIVLLLGVAIQLYLRQNPIGFAVIEGRYRLPDDLTNSRIPDLSFISKECGGLTLRGTPHYMPDLAVEVQSPGQSERFLLDKALFYLEHGSRMVWLVYPEKRMVEVLTATERHLLTESDVLLGGDVLPNFRLTLQAFFAEVPLEDDSQNG